MRQLLDVLRQIWLDAGNGSSTDLHPDEVSATVSDSRKLGTVLKNRTANTDPSAALVDEIRTDVARLPIVT